MIRAGDVADLLVPLDQLKEKARRRTGRDFPVIAVRGRIGRHWMHRILQSEGIESQSMPHRFDLAPPAPSETDGIDGETLVRTL